MPHGEFSFSPERKEREREWRAVFAWILGIVFLKSFVNFWRVKLFSRVSSRDNCLLRSIQWNVNLRRVGVYNLENDWFHSTKIDRDFTCEGRNLDKLVISFSFGAKVDLSLSLSFYSFWQSNLQRFLCTRKIQIDDSVW